MSTQNTLGLDFNLSSEKKLGRFSIASILLREELREKKFTLGQNSRKQKTQAAGMCL